MPSGRDDPTWVWDRLLTVTDYYQGPQKGIATFRGTPHAFESDPVEAPFTDRFLLMPIDQKLFELALEDWRLWRRWAFNAELRDPDSDQMVLPEDRERSAELKRLIGDGLKVDPDAAIRVLGELREADDITGDGHHVWAFQVHWTRSPED